MIGTHQLIIVGRVQNSTLTAAFALPFADFQDHAGGQLVVKIIQMAHIRLKIIQNQPDLLPGFGRINGFQGVGQLGQFGTSVKIHVGGIDIHPVAHHTAFMLHAEVLDLMAQGLEAVAKLKNIGF